MHYPICPDGLDRSGDIAGNCSDLRNGETRGRDPVSETFAFNEIGRKPDAWQPTYLNPPSIN